MQHVPQAKLDGLGRMQSIKKGRWFSNRLPMRAAANFSQPEGTLLARKHATIWDGTGSQQDLMATDQCVTVTEDDGVTGHASKYDVHRFNADQPKGVLHRAFSVFLFNGQNKLLLQQRAAGKITFPNVWTNTCCSHPLHGQTPPEVDDTNAVSTGSANGAKLAAVRKLKHELGIKPSQLPAESFKFLTRLHYCAADRESGSGELTGWGEHEMDYILFAKADVDVFPNPEEVQEVAYVSEAELHEMMAPSNGLLWSPWFRIIANKFLRPWWKDLDQTLKSDKLADWTSIHHILEE